MRPRMTPAAIEIESLTHCYGRRTALDNVSFRVDPGHTLALLGPNGGGKTTLFRILATLLQPTRGRACVCGHDVAADAPAVRRSIGVTFQSPSLDPKLTVRENLRLHGNLYGLRGTTLARRIHELAAAFGLADRAAERCQTLSGGLRRRVELAKALLHDPRVLLLDEPSTGLDPTARRELLQLLARLSDRGVTVFLTTHLMEEAENCRRVAVIDRGRLVAFDAPDALRAAVGGDVVVFETDAPQDLARHLGPPAVVEDGAVRVEHPAGHALAASVIDSFAGRVRAVHVRRPTLGDAFHRLTGHGLDDEPPPEHGP